MMSNDEVKMDSDAMIPSESSFIPITDLASSAEPKIFRNNNNFVHVLPSKEIQSIRSKCSRNNDDEFIRSNAEAADELNELSSPNNRSKDQTAVDPLLRQISISKEQINKLIVEDSTKVILKKVLNISDLPTSITKSILHHPDHSPSAVLNVEDCQRELYERNPSGRFSKSNTNFTRPLIDSRGSSASEYLKSTTALNLLMWFSNIGFAFLNGVIAGFSIRDLFNIPSSANEVVHSNFRFYFVSLSLCLVGFTVKWTEGAVSKKRVAGDILIILLQCISLLLTLANAKLELGFQVLTQLDNFSVGLELLEVNSWRNRVVVRSILCISQWLIFCSRYIDTFKESENNNKFINF